jgi:hypothetical protein
VIGFLVDPSRGLLWFAPLLVLATLGLPRLFRRDRLLAATAAALFLPSFLLAAFWVDWRGGSCYGPRLILPVLPALALPLLALCENPPRWLPALFALSFTVGFTVNASAALHPAEGFWSVRATALLRHYPGSALAIALLAVGALWRLRRSLHLEHCPLLGRL